MISADEKKQAWISLYYLIRAGSVSWPGYLSQEQIDFLTAKILRSAVPSERGKKIRNLHRWIQLNTAFLILRARQPGKSKRQLYEEVAKRYGCGWSTVRKAHLYCDKHGIDEAEYERFRKANEPDIADLDLPHINMDNFPDEK